jgi:CubicO group peptidase (beta-lactamase class C family)
MTQIVRIFTDYFLFFIRINPYNLYDLCSIFGCGLAALCTTHYAGNKVVSEVSRLLNLMILGSYLQQENHMNISIPEEAGFSTPRLGRIASLLQRYIDHKQLAGAVTLVARWGIFRIYSMTKPLTSVALMMLYEQGLVQLTDPVAKFLPEFNQVRILENDGQLAGLTGHITVQDLLRHTAGLSYGSDADTPVDELYRQAELFHPDITLQEMVRRIAGLPLVYQPGTMWRYSVATDVVGHLVEIISDMSLAEFLAARLLQPLGMVDTAYHVPPEKVHRLVTLYGPTEKGTLQVLDEAIEGDYTQAATLQPGGHGLVSTAADYLRFAQCILNKGDLDGVRLLGRKTAEMMAANHLSPALLPIHYNGIINNTVPGIGFGLGFRVMLDIGLAGIIGSAGSYGWGGAANTLFWIDPQEQLIGILMVQFLTDNVHPIRNDFRTLVYQALVD